MIKSQNLNINEKNGVTFVTFPVLEKYGIKHAFSTRLGGVSDGIYSSMNLSFSQGDNPDNVLENYKRICNAIDVDYKRCVLSKQTHTTNIRIVTEEDAGKGIIKERDFDDIDGLITNVPGLTLVVQCADCVGTLFFDPIKKVIAASHGGWRGTKGEIPKKTVLLMHEKFGCNPSDIVVGISPSIGKCCFEVDTPVAEEFMKIDSVDKDKIITYDGNGKYHIDLWQTNVLSLLSVGIKRENMSVTDLCTMCHPDVFFSHRATKGKRGNLAGLICL